MKIEPGRAVIFVIVFWILGALIHNYLKYGVQHSSTVIQSAVQTMPPPPASKEPPVVSISKIWPGGATPTKIVHIPDPHEPAQGLMDITLHQGDDVELDFDPLWIFNTTGPDSLAGTEIAISETNTAVLEGNYQSIIDRYQFTWLDFDIEGDSLSNQAANERRNIALAALQVKNPGLLL